jgi:threonine/homoserine/homoserine lactone efflux protein
MTLELYLLMIGLLGGVCSSAPIGPINLWLGDYTLKHAAKGLPQILAFVFGVIVIDICYAGFAALGYTAIVDLGLWADWISALGGIVLIGIGIIALKRSSNPATQGHPKQLSQNSPQWIMAFALGAFLCCANPGFLMFWVFAIDFINTKIGLPMIDHNVVFFLMGVALGDMIWFWTIYKTVEKGRDRISSTLILSIRRVIAVLIVLFGVAGLVTAF